MTTPTSIRSQSRAPGTGEGGFQRWIGTRRQLAVVSLITLALSLWIFRPYPSIDETRVHPSLRGLDDSTRCGWTSFGDGGSMALHIQPAGGAEVILCVSESLDQSFTEKGRIYIGAEHFSRPGATKITGYDHTKFVIAKLLAKDLPSHPSLWCDIALMTKWPSDWVSFLVHAGPAETFEALWPAS